MKHVIAFIQPFMAEKVVDALHQVQGLTGASFSEVRGFGRGRTGKPGGPEELFGTVPRVRVDVMVPDTLADMVVRTIQTAAHTGHRGDGKVYVAPVERALRISTGEDGEAAV